MVKIIGIGEYAVSRCREDVIKTYALASCVGLVVYHPRDKVLGMVHIVLPHTKESSVLRYGQGYFADKAVPLIFGKVFGGYPGESTPCQVSLYGGASSKNGLDMFCVGERNIAEISEILTQNHIKFNYRNTGGYCSRTIAAYVEDGRVEMQTQEMNYR